MISKEESVKNEVIVSGFAEKRKVMAEKKEIDSENYLGKIKSVFVHKNKLFELDKVLFKIMVFDEKFDFLFSFSRAGQGPGEIYDPGGLFISGNKVYIFNSPDRFEVYDVNGKLLNSIVLKQEKDNLARLDADSFFVYDNKLYLHYFLGNAKIKVFDIKGNFIKNLVLRKNENTEIKPGGAYLAEYGELFVEPLLNYIILSSALDGSTEVYDLKNGKFLFKFRVDDEDAGMFIERLKKKIKSEVKHRGKISVNVFLLYAVSYNRFDKTVWVLKREKTNNNWMLYIADLKKKKMKKIIFSMNEDIEIEEFLFIGKGKIFFWDNNYDFYKFILGGYYDGKI
jgi:WD40 repeat protein